MKNFCRALAAVAVHFNEKMTKERIESYIFALGDRDEDELVRACGILIKGRYFPRAHNFIEVLDGPEESVDDAANAAWSKLQTHVWGWRELPKDGLITLAMDGACDCYMIKHGSEKQVIGYGFAFRANYRRLLERDRADSLKVTGEDPDFIKAITGNIGKIETAGD